MAGTKAEDVINILEKIPYKQRKKVTEITLDMAGNMELIAKRCFWLPTTFGFDPKLRYLASLKTYIPHSNKMNKKNLVIITRFSGSSGYES